MKKTLHRILPLLLAVCLVLTLMPVTASAVDKTLLPGDVGGINSGISAVASGGDEDNTIELNPGTYQKTTDRNNSIIFNNKNLTIYGDGAPGAVIIDAQNLSHIFNITGNSNVTFKNLTLKNGVAVSGGALYIGSNGDVTITGSTFTGNTAGVNGGAIYNNGGTLTIADCAFSGNTAGGDGSAIYIDNKGVAAYLTGSVANGDYAVGNGGMIVEADTLDVPISRHGKSTGLTVKAGSGSAVWDFSTGTPAIKFTLSDNSIKTLAWGTMAQSSAAIYVALGDSVPAGYGLTDPAAESYVNLFAGLMEADGDEVAAINKSVSGLTSAQLLDALNALSAGEAVLLAGADIITLNIGGNDVLGVILTDMVNKGLINNTGAVTNVPGLMAYNPSTNAALMSALNAAANSFATNFTAIIAKLKTAAPNAELIVSTIYNPIPASLTQLAAAGTVITALNDIIRQAQAVTGFKIADTYTAFANATVPVTNVNLPTSVDIHPNAAGHALMALLHYETLYLTGITIDRQPVDTGLYPGETGYIYVAASVVPVNVPLSYQWYGNTTASNTGGTAISGQTGPILALSEASRGAGQKYYYCVVSAAGAADKTTDAASVYIGSDKGVVPIDGNGGEVTSAMVDSALGANGKIYDSYTVTIENATSIGDSAFLGCEGLISVTIPATVTAIGNYAFYNCANLFSVTFKGAPPTTFGNYAFATCAPNLTLYYDSTQGVGAWNTFITGLDHTYNDYHWLDIANKPGETECLITGFKVPGIAAANIRIDNNLNRIIISNYTGTPDISDVIPDITPTPGTTVSVYTGTPFTSFPLVYKVTDGAKERLYEVIIEDVSTTAPKVQSVAPTGANVSVTANELVITFNPNTMNDPQEMETDPSDMGAVSIDGGATLTHPVWSDDNKTLTYDLDGLAANTTYNVLIVGFTNDYAFEISPYAHSFTTASGSGNGGGSTYTVTYNANGGAGSHAVGGLASGAKHSVLTLAVTGISREGYTFTGWNTAANGGGTAYAPGDTVTVTGNITLYAQWTVQSTGKLDTVNHFAYVVGYPDGEVKPGNNITRAETATIFFRLLTQESRAEIWSTSNGFPDVNANDWHNNAISTLTNAGILEGYADGSFNPNGSITRAEFATIAVRFADTSGVSTAGISFSDISGHWAEENIRLAASLGYVEGYPDGSFKPDAPITRAEVMTLLNRVLNRHVESEADMLDDMVTFPDNTADKWYYFDVQEAVNSHYYERKADGVYEKWTELRTAPDWSALQKPGAKPGDVSY